ncbi:hypothetical protein [Bacillus sp. m3-13]|uniref:hypothetical protein n=1 Tax=Bacillus sp. m3-13 TaxID=406124 RepID=UPI0001E89099|nr:hypothetical protein [Bacillus sp. m3-13]
MGILYVESSRHEGACCCFRCSTRRSSSPQRNCDNSNSTIRSLEERIVALERLVARNAQLIAENRRLINEIENGDLTPGEVRGFFEENEGEVVTVAATFGTVTGTVLTAGTDVAEVLAPDGDVIIVPYRSVETV